VCTVSICDITSIEFSNPGLSANIISIEDTFLSVNRTGLRKLKLVIEEL
jgi:hypothetical protein